MAANSSLDTERNQQYWNATHASAGETTREDSSSGNSGKTKGGGPKMPTAIQAYEDSMRTTQPRQCRRGR